MNLVCLPLLAAAGVAGAQSSVTLSGVVDAWVALGRGSLANVRQLASGAFLDVPQSARLPPRVQSLEMAGT